eukprot:5308086-Alexandrium_andersonii.AAC.1
MECLHCLVPALLGSDRNAGFSSASRTPPCAPNGLSRLGLGPSLAASRHWPFICRPRLPTLPGRPRACGRGRSGPVGQARGTGRSP